MLYSVRWIALVFCLITATAWSLGCASMGEPDAYRSVVPADYAGCLPGDLLIIYPDERGWSCGLPEVPNISEKSRALYWGLVPRDYNGCYPGDVITIALDPTLDRDYGQWICRSEN